MSVLSAEKAHAFLVAILHAFADVDTARCFEQRDGEKILTTVLRHVPHVFSAGADELDTVVTHVLRYFELAEPGVSPVSQVILDVIDACIFLSSRVTAGSNVDVFSLCLQRVAQSQTSAFKFAALQRLAVTGQINSNTVRERKIISKDSCGSELEPESAESSDGSDGTTRWRLRSM